MSQSVMGSMGASGPVEEPERLIGLDVVRGVALLGIFLVNIQFFSGPMGWLISGRPGPMPPGDEAAQTFIEIFCAYKFISTFSLLFGAGLAMQLLRARARGGDFYACAVRRMGALMLIGAIHGAGIWY